MMRCIGRTLVDLMQMQAHVSRAAQLQVRSRMRGMIVKHSDLSSSHTPQRSTLCSWSILRNEVLLVRESDALSQPWHEV